LCSINGCCCGCEQIQLLQVSPEVVRELEQAVPRDAKGAAAAAANGAAAAAAAVVAGAGGQQRIAVESRVGQRVSEDVFNMPPVPMMDED
jgi:hypothetical protein